MGSPRWVGESHLIHCGGKDISWLARGDLRPHAMSLANVEMGRELQGKRVADALKTRAKKGSVVSVTDTDASTACRLEPSRVVMHQKRQAFATDRSGRRRALAVALARPATAYGAPPPVRDARCGGLRVGARLSPPAELPILKRIR